MKNTIVLVGNPNTGKTTLFNSIAKTNEHVGNWHGVTVDFKEKKLKDALGKEFLLTDLPGTYSLSAFSFEEAVTRDYVLSHQDAKFVNVCDVNNLARNLYLTLQLLEQNLNFVICLNMASDFKKNGNQIDVSFLERILCRKVFFVNGQTRMEVLPMIDFLTKNDIASQKANLPYVDFFEDIFNQFCKKNNIDFEKFSQFEKLKICELDEFFLKKCFFDKTIQKKAQIFFDKQGTIQKLAVMRYQYIQSILDRVIKKDKKQNFYGFSKFDKFATNRFFAIPFFLATVAMILFLTFGRFGTMLSNSLSNFFEMTIFLPLQNLVLRHTSNNFVINFFGQAVFGSITSLISFLPQILLMFFGLYILEDSGYMSRIAFSLQDIFSLVGLSGKSIFTLLMGLGCGTTATLTSRDLEDKNSKIKTAMLTPYVSCSAKLPMYTVFCMAFFPKHSFLVIFSLYILGILTALCVSFVLSKTLLPGGEQNFILEMPKYRLPSLKKIVKNTFHNMQDFLTRVGSVLLTFSAVVWILENCNFKFQYDVQNSILDGISKFLAPVFVPLGFGSYGAVACLLCGFVAKEIIVSTIALVNNVGKVQDLSQIAQSLTLSASTICLTKSSALSFLVFATLYLPCISNVSALSKEIGKKWTIFACSIEFAVAYILSFATYKIALYFASNGFLSGILSVLAFLTISAVVLFSTHLAKQKKICKSCPQCGHCHNK